MPKKARADARISSAAAVEPEEEKRPGVHPAGRPPSTSAWAAEEAATAKGRLEPRLPDLAALLEHPPYPKYRVVPGRPVALADIDPDDCGSNGGKKDVEEGLNEARDRIRRLQARLYAERKQSLLIVLQAIDTGGKDGTIRSVFQGVNPQGCQVWSFRAPSEEELAHDFLWRYHAKAPARGMVSIFNRSHYEDVLIVRVKNLVPEEVWRERYGMINQFEHLLARNRTTVLKFFLHISKAEQKRRLESRLRDPSKHWKFDPGDLVERGHWDDYMTAFEDAINRCSAAEAPWYVVPANKKWYRNLVVARTIAHTLEAMDPQFPPPAPGLDGIVVPD